MILTMTPIAVAKVKEVIEQANPKPTALRFGVHGGGCSGFSYAMVLETSEVLNENDNMFDFEGLKVLVDNMSAMYLEGCEVDYVETLESSGFKFNNPNVKTTCGCGSSFSA